MLGTQRWLLLVFCATQLAACSPFFVVRAAYEEAKILSRRQSIARLLEEGDLAEERRAKLELVVQARDFAADTLGLNAGDSYTTFSQLDSDTLALVLSAARKDSFVPYTWWFPIVGRIPYRAFFSEESAMDAVRSMESRGLDAYVRPTSAFSTLGWFNDPLVSPLLRYDSVSLANTVVHELFHNTLYLPGQAIFNESLAQFVGARGAIDFFCTRHPDEDLCGRATQAWRDELLFAGFLGDLITELETLYAREDLTSDEKIARREEVFESGRRSFEEEVRPRLGYLSFGNFARTPLNNASLIARRIYYQRLDLFEAVFQATGGDLKATLRLIIEAAEASPDGPFEGVEGILNSEF
ncbi:MAG: aminopeptidase [Gemmatimonadota bacterium]